MRKRHETSRGDVLVQDVPGDSVDTADLVVCHECLWAASLLAAAMDHNLLVLHYGCILKKHHFHWPLSKKSE